MSADGVMQGAVFAANPVIPFGTFGKAATTTLGNGALEVVSASNTGLPLSYIRSETFGVPASPTAPTTPTIYGCVVDGIVKGATVCADSNGDGGYDLGEAIATTDATGRYRFATPASGPIIATGGTDTRTGLPFTQTFTASAGSLSVTALSTLVQKMVQANGLPVGQATEQVNLALGLSLNSNLTALNPVTATLNGAATAKVLVADAVRTNVKAPAQAGGATVDLYGKLAAVIDGAKLSIIDPTSATTV